MAMNSRRLKIAVKDHRRNSAPYITALRAAGHEFLSEGPVDLLLTDLDIPYLGHKEILDRYSEMGAKVLMYPHAGGGPNLSYDGQWKADPRVHANLVASYGHAEFLRRLEYPSATHTIGWTHCQLRPFRACADVQRVVFAPTHPNGDGSMTDYQRELNSTVFRQLLECPFELTVRFIGTLEQNGLWKAKNVKFVDGRRSPQFAEMDGADAVVAGDGTFPTLAVARGVPTVMYSQGIMCLGLGRRDAGRRPRPELYWDYARFPFDVADGPLEDTVREAARSDGPVPTGSAASSASRSTRAPSSPSSSASPPRTRRRCGSTTPAASPRSPSPTSSSSAPSCSRPTPRPSGRRTTRA